MFRLRTLGLASLVAAAACQPVAEDSAAQPLTTEEAQAVTGGVSVDIIYPANNSSQTYDNLRFQANIESGFHGTPTYVSLWADSTKIGSETMNFVGQETRSWNERFNWPFPGNRDAQYKYFFNDQYFEAAGDSSRTNVRLHPSVKLYGIHFWNVQDKSSTPNVSTSYTGARVDATSTSRSKLANNIDGIFGQCGGTDKTQFRHNGTTVLDPTYNPGAGRDCSDLGEIVALECVGDDVCSDNGSVLNCTELANCLNEYASAANDFDISRGYNSAHVFHVESTPCGSLGLNITWVGTDGVSRSMSLLDAGLAGNAETYTRVLAHELMHDAALGHCNQNGGAGTGCTPSDCNSSSSSVRNLMCSSGTGRDLTPEQCNLVQNFRWDDRN